MNRICAFLILLCCTISFFASPASAVTIAWTAVGNPGNVADTVVMNDGTTGYGSVPYSFNIGTYDVTNSQYVEFLNSNDPTGADPLALYNSQMSTFGGIKYNSGAANGSKYSVISGDGNHPVNYVTWYDAIRFANWLNNGQVPGSTETGAYTLLGGTPTPSNGDSITRNPGATVFLSSENEWYKAAYYNPATGSYFHYATSSNTAPTAVAPPGGSNSANYEFVASNTVSDVGAYTHTTSPYGAFDMNGDVYQWNETLMNVDHRGVRGGGFASVSANLISSYRNGGDPAFENSGGSGGFRVASIPEPSTFLLAGLGMIGLVGYARHRRKRLEAVER
jgi:formylglycine-generating enzyme required for sulfatase activity